jgi:hypothetical protein
MAIEIESGFSLKKSVLPITVFLIGLIIASFLVASYIFLYFSSDEITQQIEEKNESLAETPSEKALREEVSGYQSRINNFNTLLENRKRATNVFSFLEQICHPDVWFKNLNYKAEDNSVFIRATAPDFIVLAQQLLILKQHQDILSKITLSDIGAGEEEEIGFSLNLVLAPQIFK